MQATAPPTLRPTMGGPGGARRFTPNLLARRIPVVLATLGYIALLHYAYAEHVSPQFSYLAYTYREPDLFAYGVSIAAIVAVALVLPRTIFRPSHFIVWVLFIVVILPSIVIAQISKTLTVPEALEFTLWVAFCFFLVAYLGTGRPLRNFMPRFHVPHKAFWAIILVVTAVIYLYVIATVGVHFKLPSFEDVYTTRDEYKHILVGSSLLGYVVPLVTGVIHPLMITYGLFGRRWLWLLLGVFGQVFIYSFTGYKGAIFSPLAMFLLYLLFRKARRPSGGALLIGVGVVAGAILTIDSILRTYEFTSLIVRRFLITPGLLTGGYVSVFDDIDKAHLAHSILKPFFLYPYLQQPPLIVGAVFFGHPGTNANASFLADGFANFGYAGMVGASVLLILLLWLIDDAARGVPIGVASLLFFMPALAFAESGILTAMLTHGVLVAILITTMMPRTGWAYRKREPWERELERHRARAPAGSVPAQRR